MTQNVNKIYSTFQIAAGSLALFAPICAVASGGGDPPPPASHMTLENIRQILSYVTIGAGLVGAIFAYLQGTLRNQLARRTLLRENIELKAQLSRLSPEQVALSAAPPESEPKSKIHLLKIREEFVKAYDVYSEQIRKFEVRANLNLAIGIAISSVAVYTLFIQLGSTPPVLIDWPNLFSAYFPRVVFCVFIELFALFFLRIYRASLLEVQSYQNDLRDLTIKQVAIESIWDEEITDGARTKIAMALINKSAPKREVKEPEFSVDPEAIADLIQKFAKTVLKKEKPNGKPDD